MNFGVKVEGGAELAKAFNALEEAVGKKTMRHVLKKAGEPIRAAAASGMKRSAEAPHAAEAVQVQVGKSGFSAAIGPTRDFYYWRFQELGTVRHPAQPALRPAFDQRGRQSLEIMSDELWWAIRHGIPSGRTEF